MKHLTLAESTYDKIIDGVNDGLTVWHFRYIHGVNSQYDCTGCLFTEWFKVFRRRGRWYAYHCIGMDI